MRVTAVPAQHGPDGTEHLTGPVTGFVLHGDGVPTVYVSGDNASLRAVAEIAERFPAVDVAILSGGPARTALLGDADLTLGAAGILEAARLLKAATVVPVHVDSWAHFTEGPRTSAPPSRPRVARSCSGSPLRCSRSSAGTRTWSPPRHRRSPGRARRAATSGSRRTGRSPRRRAPPRPRLGRGRRLPRRRRGGGGLTVTVTFASARLGGGMN
ncbi:MBL fold metallo-hydrolase [Dactylosporangium siamense]|uniref:Metallo-beta-lactamase domain-containing protein n=1 Tax=Dactylosporangium siamense TaxID=685454 RepID=A0A919PCQ6_9ACTN|nr:MBL fold metallo-hydrolase [Dactylosporangium siamense]GIG42360.1 hypothetical protein Dsi01nite_004010 [Dactylosporangium siamense]